MFARAPVKRVHLCVYAASLLVHREIPSGIDDIRARVTTILVRFRSSNDDSVHVFKDAVFALDRAHTVTVATLLALDTPFSPELHLLTRMEGVL